MLKRSLCLSSMLLLLVSLCPAGILGQSDSERTEIINELMRETGAKSKAELDEKLKILCRSQSLAIFITRVDLPYKLLLHSTNSKQLSSQAVLNTPVKPTMATYAVVPKNFVQFHRVFNEVPNIEALRRIKRINQTLIEKHLDTPSQYINQEGFKKFVSQSPANFIVILGHNERGGFIFPGDVAMSLSEMAKIWKDSGKRCIILSCKSNRYVADEASVTIDSFITYDEAINMASRLQNHFVSLPPNTKVTNIDVIKLLESIQKDHRIKSKARYIVTGLGVGAAVVGTIVIIQKAGDALSDDDNDEEQPMFEKPVKKRSKVSTKKHKK